MKEQLSHNRQVLAVYSAVSKSCKDGGEKGVEWDGLLKSRVHLSHSFLFILLVCFFFQPPHLQHHPPISFPRLQHTFALPSFNFSPPSSSLFSSLCLSREKRFCLLLVSAPSQSAFLISSYCFCLIFKCYPGPNGNPYKKKKRQGGERVKERETGWVLCFTPGPRDKSPPLRERFGGFWGG